jgi:hypothetical protein
VSRISIALVSCVLPFRGTTVNASAATGVALSLFGRDFAPVFHFIRWPTVDHYNVGLSEFKMESNQITYKTSPAPKAEPGEQMSCRS